MAVTYVIEKSFSLFYSTLGDTQMKKLLYIVCMSAVFSLSAAVLSFAAQTDRWHEDNNGTWYLSMKQRLPM